MSREEPKRGQCDHLHGQYANYFEVGHNASEFVIDMGQFYQNNGEASVHTRIVTGPIYAKALLDLLTASVSNYERLHGRIPEDPQ